MVEDIIKDKRIVTFLIEYISLETAVKQVVTLLDLESSSFKMDIRSVTSVLKEYGVIINPQTLFSVFSASVKRNHKSCKKLRDGIVHSLKKGDLEEVKSRYSELMEDMREIKTAMLNRY